MGGSRSDTGSLTRHKQSTAKRKPKPTSAPERRAARVRGQSEEPTQAKPRGSSRPPRALSGAPRRTQQERREQTIQRLVAATIQALLELGYARTTVNEICRRAGLSHGALFRFFPTLTDLVLAGAEEVARLRIAEFESHFAQAGAHADPHRTALRLLRDACRSPSNMVFYELLVAARTDDTLRPKLRLGMQRYRAAIRDSSLKVPALAALDANVRDMLVFTFINYFDGESLFRSVLPEPDEEDARFELLMFAINFALDAGADKIATSAPATTHGSALKPGP